MHQVDNNQVKEIDAEFVQSLRESILNITLLSGVWDEKTETYLHWHQRICFE